MSTVRGSLLKSRASEPLQVGGYSLLYLGAAVIARGAAGRERLSKVFCACTGKRSCHYTHTAPALPFMLTLKMVHLPFKFLWHLISEVVIIAQGLMERNATARLSAPAQEASVFLAQQAAAISCVVLGKQQLCSSQSQGSQAACQRPRKQTHNDVSALRDSECHNLLRSIPAKWTRPDENQDTFAILGPYLERACSLA